MRWFIALRYFLSHKRQSAVCIAGVMISVMMFISMSAMMDGFRDKFIVETVESSGHITIKDEPRETRTPILERVYRDPNALLAVQRVKPRDQVKKIQNPTGLLAALGRMPGIVAAAPTVQGNVIATFGTKNVNLDCVGIEPEKQIRVTTIEEDMLEGGFSRLRTTANGIVIGKG